MIGVQMFWTADDPRRAFQGGAILAVAAVFLFT
jgi:hypothetical protein